MPNAASRPPAPSTNLTRRKRHCGSALAPRSRATDLGVAFLGEPTAGPQLTRGGLREVRFRSWWGRTGPWSSHAVPHRHGVKGDHATGGAWPRLPPPATPGPQHGAEGLVYPPSSKGQVRGGWAQHGSQNLHLTGPLMAFQNVPSFPGGLWIEDICPKPGPS